MSPRTRCARRLGPTQRSATVRGIRGEVRRPCLRRNESASGRNDRAHGSRPGARCRAAGAAARACFGAGLCNSAGMNHRSMLVAAGVLGGAGVMLGAFGAHGLHEKLLASGMANAWETAVRYHLLHAVALVGLAAWARGAAPGAGSWVARCWVGGTILFSGSLYALALGGPRWLGPVTPLGGLLLTAGWILLVVAGVKAKAPASSDTQA